MMMPARRRPSPACPGQRSGFSLIELVTVISLAGLIAGVVAPPFVQATQARHRMSKRGILLSEGRTALERMIREWREIHAAAGDDHAADITTAEARSMRFESTGYRVNDTTLERLSENSRSWRPMASHVSSLALTYFDEAGSALTRVPLNATDRGRVRRIIAVLTLTHGGESITLRSGAFLRYFAHGNAGG